MPEKLRLVTAEDWDPKTALGRMVKSGQISDLEQIFELGKPILEPEIVDILLPELNSETLDVKTTQRVTDSGKRTRFRVVVVVGDGKGHAGVGVGKSDEIKPALEYAVRNAKKNVVSIKMGCGSWECKCNFTHSLPKKTSGKAGSTIVVLKPAPRGLGLAASDVIKKVLGIGGVKDVWSSSLGGSNLYNMAVATMDALNNLNRQKPLG